MTVTLTPQSLCFDALRQLFLFFLFLLSSTLPSACDHKQWWGGTWSRVVVTHTGIIYVYYPQDVKREITVFFFFLFRILRKKLGDFT